MFFLGSYGDQDEKRVLAGQGRVAREVSDVKKLPEEGNRWRRCAPNFGVAVDLEAR